MEAAAGNTAGAFLPLGSVGWPTAENVGSGAVARHRYKKTPLTNNLDAVCATRPLQIIRLGWPDKAKRFV
jgi:hypothetical protein